MSSKKMWSSQPLHRNQEDPARKPKLLLAITQTKSVIYSNFTKLQRIFEYVIRFIQNANVIEKGYLTTMEFDKLMMIILRIVQRERFAQDLH